MTSESVLLGGLTVCENFTETVAALYITALTSKRHLSSEIIDY